MFKGNFFGDFLGKVNDLLLLLFYYSRPRVE